MPEIFEKDVSIEEWIGICSRDVDKGALRVIRCTHVLNGQYGAVDGQEVIGLQIPQGGRAWNVKEAAETILGRARMVSQGLQGVQTYKLEAFYDESNEPRTPMYFSLTGKNRLVNGWTEDPDDRGVRAQGMRHLESNHSMALRMMQQADSAYRFMMQRQEEALHYYMREARDASGIVMKLLQQQAIDQSNARMRELEFMRSTDERRRLILMLPAILHHVSGQKYIPEGMADESILEVIADRMRKMTPDQQQAMLAQMSNVSPELVYIVGKRLKEITERQKAEEEVLGYLAQAKKADANPTEKEVLPNGPVPNQLEAKH